MKRLIGTLRWISVFLVITMLLSASAGPGGASAAPQAVGFIYLPQIPNRFDLRPGSVSGRVVDAATNQPLDNAIVSLNGSEYSCVEPNPLCDSTDDQGMYALESVPSGNTPIWGASSGYKTLIQRDLIVGDQPNTVNFVLTQDLITEDLYQRVILTWNETEVWPNTICPPGNPNQDPCANDLDAHMWYAAAVVYHVYPQAPDSDCTITPYVCHKVDMTNGFGPETIDVRVTEPGVIYHYGVHNVNQIYDPNVPNILQTGAVVRLYDQSGLIHEYTIAGATGTEGNFWYVYSMDANGNITERNCIIWNPGDNPPSCTP